MNYVDIKKHDETVLTRLSEYEEEFKTGIINHFHAYINRISADAVVYKDGRMYVSEGLISEIYINTYLEKIPREDFGAKDCAYLAIDRLGIPPEEELSIESIEKFIRGIIVNDYIDKAYVKHVKGKKNVVCVNREIANKIIYSPNVNAFIDKQIKKAEKKDIHNDKVAWRAYELQKKQIEYLTSSEDNSDCYLSSALSTEQETKIMVEAIFKMLYSNFDFAKYASYKDEMWLLGDNWDFGERFQELEDIFNSPDYKGEFYKISPDNALLDVLADKIAEKIIEKTTGNGSKK